ncbi:MAG: ribonuclease P protein component 1 [Candidatus Diapherotrites archaeon]
MARPCQMTRKALKRKPMVNEIIGLKVKVIDSPDKGRVGLTGVIVDETKNTLKIDVGGEEKILPKAEVVLEFEQDGEKVVLDCRKIMFKPEDRIKRCWR